MAFVDIDGKKLIDLDGLSRFKDNLDEILDEIQSDATFAAYLQGYSRLEYTTTEANEEVLIATEMYFDSVIIDGDEIITDDVSTGDELYYTFDDAGVHYVYVKIDKSRTLYMSMFKACTALTKIPALLFLDCSNATSFYNCFNNCTGLTTLPKYLFKNCSSVTTFKACFAGCTSLKTIESYNIFEGCTAVTTFNETFYNCSSLEEIPVGLFYYTCPNVTTYEETFYGCTSIKEIPSTIFLNNSLLESVSYCFYDCTGLSCEFPEDLFLININIDDFSYCFCNCSGLTGNAPELWNDDNFKEASGTGCFRKCSGLDNYDDIPSGWC